ncbi:glycosyltransferase family 61 protein [Sphingomonas arantia]|uniref:Glycosyltransferase family 61 protein n=1 Tax=Sphingomonas arantia TaxID=1460676 RepID=A0ABW4TU54_9SPHN
MEFKGLLLSGSEDRIYGGGSCIALEDRPNLAAVEPEAVGVTFLAETFPAETYRWNADPDMLIARNAFADSVLQGQAAMADRVVAASVALTIDHAVIAHSVIYLPSADGAPNILYQTYRPNDRPATSLIGADLVAAAENPSFYRADAAYMYLGSAGSFNYGHWLVDDLTRAKTWLDFVATTGTRPVVVLPMFGAGMDAVRRKSLQTLIDPDIEVEFIDPNRAYRFHGLLYATPTSFHPVSKSPAALDFVIDRARRLLPPSQLTRRDRIFVARRSEQGRSILNQPELIEMLEQFGFTMIYSEDHDFVEQVQIFSNASVIIGQMGAAMTNTMFCRSTTSIIYLAPNGWVEPFYLDLSSACGIQYRVLYDDVMRSDKPPHLSDFQVPVDVLASYLTTMGLRVAA